MNDAAGAGAVDGSRRRRADATGIAALAALTGASCLVLQCFAGGRGVIALAVFEATLAAGFLAPWLRDPTRRLALLRHAGWLVGLSLLSATLPFVPSAFAASRDDPALRAVAQASLPLAVTFVGAVWLGARAGGVAFAGFVVGVGGAALLALDWLSSGPAPHAVGVALGAAGGVAAVVWRAPAEFALVAASIAALCSVAGTPAHRRPRSGAEPVVLAVAAQGGAALTLLLPALRLWRGAGVDGIDWSGVALLGIVGAGVGRALYLCIDRRGGWPAARRARAATPGLQP